MSQILKSLIDAPESINPALVMHQRIASQNLGVAELLSLKPEIERAAKAGQEELREVSRAIRTLIDCDAVPSDVVPEGF